jgi:hypothetical protein
VPIIGLDIYNILSVSGVFPTIIVNQAKDVHIIGFTSGQLFNRDLSVTVPLPVSQSRKAVAHAPLISVPLPVALVTVMALVDVCIDELITNLLAALNVTVSVLVVNALIAVCILLAIIAIVVSVEKFNPLTVLNVQSIVIAKLPLATACQVAITVVGASPLVKNAGRYDVGHIMNSELPSYIYGLLTPVSIIVYIP